MKRFNLLFSLYTLTAFIVILERLSPTSKMLLHPYKFIGLHEIIQALLFLPITVVLSFFLLHLVTNNFQTLQKRKNVVWALFFILGMYFYGTGEGWHEVVGSIMNQHCNVNITSQFCQSLFVNYYYLGNIVFFLGGIMSTVSLMILATQQPSERFSNKDMVILLFNSLIYGLSWFAYAAFDRVLIGLFSVAILTVISFWFLYKIRGKVREYPYVLSGIVSFTFATIATFLVRFFR